jgi:IS30 family transposase
VYTLGVRKDQVEHLLLQGAAMAKFYQHLTTQERTVVMTMRTDLCSIRSIAKRLRRSASTISRERKRTSGSGVYDANLAHAQCHAR